jgi:hypothetical protein
LVWLQRRHFAPDRLERDLQKVRANAAAARAAEGAPSPSLGDRVRSWREARDSRFVETIRREAAAIGADTEAAAAQALAQLDAVLAKHVAARAFNQTMIEHALTDVHATVTESMSDLAHAVGQVSNMCVGVIGHIQDNREQTRELERAVARLAPRTVEPQERVISLVEEEARERAEQQAVEAEVEDDVEFEDDDVSGEILYFENDEWFGGVEIIDRTGENGSTRYWLRRASDGYILPRSFGADEVWIPAGVDSVHAV